MPSNSALSVPQQIFVWIWLPGAVDPVVCGRMVMAADGRVIFNYGQSYLARQGAIPVFLPDLPLQAGAIEPMEDITMAGCLRDGSPDSWGRRVIINRLTSMKGAAVRDVELDELLYLIHSGSDRIGALDFQLSATTYVPRQARHAPLEELQVAAELIQAGEPLTPALDDAINHGTSVGGARPKAIIEDGDKRLIAKFSATDDTYSIVKAEFLGMSLGRRIGLDVAPVRMVRAANKDVLLVERFDRHTTNQGQARRAMVSALTLQGLDELAVRHASYEILIEIMRDRFTAPRAATREMFGRLALNILVGNTDDHPRNHAAFWDGSMLTLTPAYDICPQLRRGGEATQGMKIIGEDRRSRIQTLLDAASLFGIPRRKDAIETVEGMIEAIRDNWKELCDQSEVSSVDRRLFADQMFLTSYAFEELEDDAKFLAASAGDVRDFLRR
jgi:serine/threonine-protein kinase HipA